MADNSFLNPGLNQEVKNAIESYRQAAIEASVNSLAVATETTRINGVQGTIKKIQGS